MRFQCFLLFSYLRVIVGKFLENGLDENLGTFYLANYESEYEGIIMENEIKVNVTPAIVTIGEVVCHFFIMQNNQQHSVPFEIEIKDQNLGTGELKAIHTLNCEDKRSYQFEIQALSCSGTYSNKVGIHVNVQDRNEFSPQWKTKNNLSFTIPENQILSDIVRVEAFDEDCSSAFGHICNYEIVSTSSSSSSNQNSAIGITETGSLFTTMPLSSNDFKEIMVEIVAYDCGHRNSLSLYLTLLLSKACDSHFSSSDERSMVTYLPGTGPQVIFPSFDFNLCETDSCQPFEYEALIQLETHHIGKGCDRNTYNLEAQRQLCGSSYQAIDLLSDYDWLKDFGIRDRGFESGDASIVKLDGQSGVLIPESLLSSFDPSSKFTLALWLRHTTIKEKRDKHTKEHIICKADDHLKNRHHFSVFLRNCKLVLLIREEYEEGKENIFRPAEWRWNLPQVCDDEWHHYALNVDFPNVELVIDGDKWTPEKNNPEIVDDLPLHQRKDIQSKMSLGACWQGANGTFKHGLTGYLAALSLLPKSIEHPEVLKCLHQCAESLQIPASSNSESYVILEQDAKQSSVKITGKNKEELIRMLRQIAYLNTREFPAPGKRTANLTLRLLCSSELKKDFLFQENKDIIVLPVLEPYFQIKGPKKTFLEFQNLISGVFLFSDIQIFDQSGAESSNYLDKCILRISPALTFDHENILLPENELNSCKIEGRMSETGVELFGSEKMYHYERVLRRTQYVNRKPAYYLNRVFSVTCFASTTHSASNEYVLSFVVRHSESTSSKLSIPQMDDSPFNSHRLFHSHEIDLAQPKIIHSNNVLHSLLRSSHGNIGALSSLLAVALFLSLLFVGVLRLRGRHSGREESIGESEMLWDDSSLNIIVNPMEEKENLMPFEESMEESEDEDEYSDEYSDEEQSPRHKNHFEWDHNI